MKMRRHREGFVGAARTCDKSGDSGICAAPRRWVPDQVLNDEGSERRGAVRAATATHRLRFLGFARNDILGLEMTLGARDDIGGSG
jgi:hypothetical protein